VFDNDLNWLDVGYHEHQKILVCGESFDPAELSPVEHGLVAPATVREVLDRLPPLMRDWVRGFHWNSPIDLINYIAGPLMTVLMPLFVEAGHPAMMFWGNKPGIGKSLAAQCLAILKDGEQAAATSIEGGAKEVENQIASEFNDGRTTLFIDNQKGPINCPILEANMTCAQLGYRGMFVQSKIRRPNDVLWLITTNDGTPSDDLLSRCIHSRLHYEGDPASCRYGATEDEIVRYMKANRAGILAEAAGMVRRWMDAGRVLVHTPGRFEKFSNTVGSILVANGLPGFLSNARAEIREHSTKLQQLTAIAERIIDERKAGFLWEVDCPIDEADDRFKAQMPEHAIEPKDWVSYLIGAGVILPTCNTSQKQKVAVTEYMKTVVKEPLEVVVGDALVQVMIVSRPLRSRRTAYALAVQGLAAVPVVEAVDDSAANLDLDAPSPVAAEGDAAAGPAAAQPSPELPSGEPDEDGDLWGV
jgi:DNA polymerase III delta prime subunit